MKDEVLQQVRGIADPAGKLNLLREYVQALSLRSLHESRAFLQLAFVGGTALRFVASLPRFSEDLDFSLHQPDGYDPVRWMKKIKQDLTLAGFDPEVTWSDQSTVHKGWIRLAGILNEAGLSALPQQKLSIKLEIDTRPPAGARTVRNVINRHRLLALQYYDLPSLMAGKLDALIKRGYPKGRDWYDLVWYRSQRPRIEPNLELLQNALDQRSNGPTLQAAHWRSMLSDKVATIDTRKLVDDVAPFLERPEEAEFLGRDYLLSILAAG